MISMQESILLYYVRMEFVCFVALRSNLSANLRYICYLGMAYNIIIMPDGVAMRIQISTRQRDDLYFLFLYTYIYAL